MPDNTTMIKATLLERISISWQELQLTVSTLSEAEMGTMNAVSGWRVVDHLAHLAAWEQGIAYLLTRRPRHEGMGITADQWRDLSMDEINEVIHQRWREQSAAAVLDYSRAAHDEMLHALAVLDETDLQRDYAHFDVEGAFAGQPMINWIVGNTYAHYTEHLTYIREVPGR